MRVGIISHISLLIALGVCAFGVSAQDATPTPQIVTNPAEVRPAEQRGDMLRQLGLSRQQMQQIRRLNQERKPLIEAAQTRYRNAVKALDDAIYADELDEQAFQTCLREVQESQSELHRVRYQSELGIRRVLTADQLSQFRELRRQFAEERKLLKKANAPVNGPVRKAIRQVRTNRQTQLPRNVQPKIR